MNRRAFSASALAALASSALAGASVCQTQSIPPSAADAEETSFTQWYDVDRGITNLENAYWNVMAKPVEKEYFRKLRT